MKRLFAILCPAAGLTLLLTGCVAIPPLINVQHRHTETETRERLDRIDERLDRMEEKLEKK